MKTIFCILLATFFQTEISAQQIFNKLSYADKKPASTRATNEPIQIQTLTTSVIQNEEISCDDLISFLERKGSYFSSVSQIQLFNSEWLKEVKAYKFEGRIFVVASIIINKTLFQSKDYIFCDISEERWDAFSNQLNFSDKRSYGEKFHDYIFDKKCNCNL